MKSELTSPDINFVDMITENMANIGIPLFIWVVLVLIIIGLLAYMIVIQGRNINNPDKEFNFFNKELLALFLTLIVVIGSFLTYNPYVKNKLYDYKNEKIDKQIEWVTKRISEDVFKGEKVVRLFGANDYIVNGKTIKRLDTSEYGGEQILEVDNKKYKVNTYQLDKTDELTYEVNELKGE